MMIPVRMTRHHDRRGRALVSAEVLLQMPAGSGRVYTHAHVTTLGVCPASIVSDALRLLVVQLEDLARSGVDLSATEQLPLLDPTMVASGARWETQVYVDETRGAREAMA